MRIHTLTHTHTDTERKMETTKLYKLALKPQMLFRKTINQTKSFVHKTLQNFKSFLLRGYKKLPKSHAINPLFGCNNNSKMQELDNFYIDFSERWESEHNEVMTIQKKSTSSAKEPLTRAKDASSRSFTNNTTQEERGKEEKKTGDCHEEKRREPCSQSANGGARVLARKMKELEKMDVDDDVDDQVLDIEEVFHYYSRLNSSVYLDIVDNFVIDICSDFLIPQPSANVNNSIRRLDPASANNSMRFGPVKL